MKRFTILSKAETMVLYEISKTNEFSHVIVQLLFLCFLIKASFFLVDKKASIIDNRKKPKKAEVQKTNRDL